MWKIYKPGQGYHTRIWSSVAFGAMAVALAIHVHQKLGGVPFFTENWQIHLAVPLVLMAISGYLVYWLCGSNPRTVDFFVATEGEMKKVTWSSWKEVKGATKVVIGMMVVMSLYIFGVDFLVSSFFRLSWVGVLQDAPVK